MTSQQDQISELERQHGGAVDAAKRLMDRLLGARADAEEERRRRRDEVWRSQLAEIESEDLKGAVAEAKRRLAASIRGDDPVPPVTALYRLVVAERRLDAMLRYAAERREQLGLPGETTAAMARPFDSVEVLRGVIDAEIEHTIATEADRLRAESEAAWRNEDLPPVPPRLNASRYTFLQDAVANAKRRVIEARGRLAAAEAAEDSSPTKADAITGAAQELSDAQEMALVAGHELVEFKAGRTT